MSSCPAQQTISETASFPVVTWRGDTILPQPKLISPRPDANVCFNSQVGLGFVILDWEAVVGANTYLVQWSNNPQMQGSTIREAVVMSPSTAYVLLRNQDFRDGEEIYWRVIAANDTPGSVGASPMSAVRKLSFSCEGDEANEEGDKGPEFDIYLELGGKASLECCDRATYFLYASYARRDQFGNELLDIENVVWSVQKSAVDGVAYFVESALGFKKILEVCLEETQVVKIKAVVTFNNVLEGGTFTKEIDKKVIVDCAVPKWRDVTVCDNKAISLVETYKTSTTLKPLAPGPGYEVIMDPTGALTCTKHVVASGPVYQIPTEETVQRCCGIPTECCYCVPEIIPTCFILEDDPDPGDEDKACFKFVYDPVASELSTPVWIPDRQVVSENGLYGLCNVSLSCVPTGGPGEPHEWDFQAVMYDLGNCLCIDNILIQSPLIVEVEVAFGLDPSNPHSTIELDWDPLTGFFGPGEVIVNQLGPGSTSNSKVDVYFDPVGSTLDYTLTQTPGGTSSGSVPVVASLAQITWTETGGGDDVTLDFIFLAATDCAEYVFDEQFEFCGTPFRCTIPLTDDPNPVTHLAFNQYNTDEECDDCENSLTDTLIETSILEARVNIGLGCGLKLDGEGRLAIDENGCDSVCKCPDTLTVQVCTDKQTLTKYGGIYSGTFSMSACCDCEDSQTDVNQANVDIEITCTGTDLQLNFSSVGEGICNASSVPWSMGFDNFNQDVTCEEDCYYVEGNFDFDFFGECTTIPVHISNCEEPITTTTTPGPPDPEENPCENRCSWIWDDTAKIWEVYEDCFGTTSTTSTSTTSTTSTSTSTSTSTTSTSTSTTTSSTTSTTPCATTSTTTSTTTTTTCECCDPSPPDPGDVTTTTTTSDPNAACECIYPEFCGDYTGQITETYCTRLDRGDPPDCGGPTTTSTTTTTSCDCATTSTTVDVLCTAGCLWHALPVFGHPCTELQFAWFLIEYNCDVSCPCRRPIELPICDAKIRTDCIVLPTTRPPEPPSCGGECDYVFIVTWDRWVLVNDTCTDSPGTGHCFCEPPPYPGDPCECTSTYCKRTTTTPDPDPCAPCYTTTTFPPGSVGACCFGFKEPGVWTCEDNYTEIECYAVTGIWHQDGYCDGLDCEATTTSTTTTSTTTTTGNPCDIESCIWEWDGVVWSLWMDTCPVADCPCAYPSRDGNYLFELYPARCDESGTTTTSTTSTSTTSTTSTSTTSTTTTPVPTGGCCHGFGVPRDCEDDWTLSQCNAVSGDWYEGYTCGVDLDCDSPPTTTSTTSTTSTTPEPCPPIECRLVCIAGDWVADPPDACGLDAECYCEGPPPGPVPCIDDAWLVSNCTI